MKKRWIWLMGSLFVYLGLLRLLAYVESAAPDASITTMTDALWFSLVTLTTAGYGDLYPVTAGGRLVGTLFLLLSTGLLAALISGVVLLASRRIIPQTRLLLRRRRSWYIFPQLNRESAALAQNLSREQPRAELVFCHQQERAAGIPEDWVLTDASPETLLRWHRRPRGCVLLVMGPDGLDNLERARRFAQWGAPVYCQTGLTPEGLPDNLKRFDGWESCARLYWQRRPLGRREGQVVLCGFGRCAAALLEQALLVNVFPAGRRTVYHIFGDGGDFLRDHPGLSGMVDLDETGTGRDAVLFHRERWDDCPELLSRADRVILCADGDEENLDMLRRIRRYVPLEGALHLRLSRALEGEAVFGTDGELFSPELVLRTELDRAAMAMHNIYRQSAGGQAPRWEELSDFLRRSNLAAADHLLTKVRLLLEDDGITQLTAENCRAAYLRWQQTRTDRAAEYQNIEHWRWMRFYLLNGWRYAPVRDNLRRRHPDLRPFAQLTPAEQAKDDYAWQLLGALADSMGSNTWEDGSK